MDRRGLARITREPLREVELTEFVRDPAAGGVVVFAGVVRDRQGGRRVRRIEYEAAEALAGKRLRAIVEEVLEDPAILRAGALHRIGTLEVGEASVMVAASAAHREEAFRAARRLIDRIKEALPVWKKEHFEDGTAEWAAGFAIPTADRDAGTDSAGEERC